MKKKKSFKFLKIGLNCDNLHGKNIDFTLVMNVQVQLFTQSLGENNRISMFHNNHPKIILKIYIYINKISKTNTDI